MQFKIKIIHLKKASLKYATFALRMVNELYSSADHPFKSQILNNLGVVQFSLGNFEVALEHLLESIRVRETVFNGDDHPLLAVSYFNLAHVYEHLDGEKVKSDAYMQKSQQIVQKRQLNMFVKIKCLFAHNLKIDLVISRFV